jgi:IMP cyclohydrolase
MPLLKGKSNIGRNIAELVRSGHQQKQAEAIAERVARGDYSEVENLMAADTRDDGKEGPALETAVAEMDALVGAVREVAQKVDAMEQRKDAPQ